MLQIKEQTKEEKMAMYMKLPKKKLIEMLINCNDVITELTQVNINPYNVVGELTCDKCGCHPNMIYKTNKGRFCEKCNPEINYS